MTACIVLSSAAYFFFSEAVRAERRGDDYRSLLWASFTRGAPHPLVEPFTIDAAGLLMVVALLVTATASALLFRRVIGSRSPDVLPEVIVYATGAIIIPPLILALIFWPDGRGYLRSDMLVMATGATMAFLLLVNVRRGRRAPDPHPLTAAQRTFSGVWALVFVFGAAAYGAIVAVFALSDIRGPDSFGYHLPIAASWLEHSRLLTNVEESVAFFYPSNGEILVRWALTVGTDRFAFIPAFIQSLLCLYVIWKIARQLGQSPTAAAVAASSASSCVLLGAIAASVYIDAFTALAVLLAVLFLLRLLERIDDVPLTVALGTAIGLAVGSKYSALQPALLICGMWLYWLGRRYYRPYHGLFEFIEFRPVARMIGIFAIPAILSSGYWYLRNAIEHGNPLFPFAVFGWPGIPMRSLIHVDSDVANPVRWLIYPWREMRTHALEDLIGGVFGGVALIGLALALFHRGSERASRTVAGIAAGSIALWVMTGNFQPRYGIFPILLSFVFVGRLWDRYQTRVLRWAIFGTFALTLFIFGRGFATHAVYVAMTGRGRYGVPAAVDVLKPAVILNATSSLANYYLMGGDYRHRVIALFRPATPQDVATYRPDYVLLHPDDVPEFARSLPLAVVARSDRGDQTEAVLCRVQMRGE